MERPPACGYAHTYGDARTGAVHEYRCPRLQHGRSRRCILHADPSSVDPSEARRAFIDELESGLGMDGGGPLLFVGCQIPPVDVTGIRGSRTVDFTDARFLGDMGLSDMACESINFADARFAGRLWMANVAADALSLIGARFEPGGGGGGSPDGDDGAGIDLDGCRFGSLDMSLVTAPSIQLSGCDFHDASFRGSRVGDLRVTECEFGRSADFITASLGTARFDAATFGRLATFEGATFERSARFARTHFRQQEMVRFCRTLSNVSFLDTNMTKIRFDADTVWNDGDGDPHAVLDERDLARDPSASSLSDTLAVYRSLRECHEYWLMYGEAGQFYIREMDLRRRYRDAGDRGGAEPCGVRRYVSLISGYNVLCRYGESLGRASAWVAGVFGAAVIYYFLFPDPGAQGGHAARLAGSLDSTLAAFLHAGRGGIDDHLVRIASLPTLGSMFIVLKRRLERRFRH